MQTQNTHRSRTGAWISALLIASMLGGAVAPLTAHAKGKTAYVPGISLVPEVLTADGVTDRTYNTPQGMSLWMNSLPIVQGDKVKLNVFAATGGSDLKQIIVRLDNSRLPGMPITTAPWNTVLDTTTLAPGYHMVEVWAEATGGKSTTKTLSFFITKQLDARYQVQGSQQILTSGQITDVPLEGTATPTSDTPQTPSYLQGQPTDASATVTITARSAASATDTTTGGAAVSDGSYTINEPTLFFVQKAPGSTAVNFAYALVRDGATFSTSAQPLPTSYQAIRIQKRSDATPGLRSGTVTMWVWGIDAQGQPSDPVKTQLMIP